jgi:MFS/sugar transport protein
MWRKLSWFMLKPTGEAANFTQAMRLTLLALPLGFTVVPLYMLLPRIYEGQGLSLSLIGLILMGAHLVDAALAPQLGKILGGARRVPLQRLAFSLLLLSFTLLFLLPFFGVKLGAAFMLALLATLVSVSDSVLIISLYAAHNTINLATKRESFLGAGLLMGVLAFEIFSPPFYILLFALLLGVGFFLFPAQPLHQQVPLRLNKRKKNIFIFIVLNSLPSAITSVLFFTYVEGVLGRKDLGVLMLVAFFGAAALAQPFWQRVTQVVSQQKALLGAMMLMLTVFPLAAFFPSPTGFLSVCLLSGLAMGGETMLMPLLLTQALEKEDAEGHALFGLLAFIGKTAFAIAAGIAFPFAVWMGMEAGGEVGARAIILSYVGLPSAIKIVALIYYKMKVYGNE